MQVFKLTFTTVFILIATMYSAKSQTSHHKTTLYIINYPTTGQMKVVTFTHKYTLNTKDGYFIFKPNSVTQKLPFGGSQTETIIQYPTSYFEKNQGIFYYVDYQKQTFARSLYESSSTPYLIQTLPEK